MPGFLFGCRKGAFPAELLGLSGGGELAGQPSLLSGIGAGERASWRCCQALVAQVVDTAEWQTIRDALQRGQLTGNTRFIEEVAQLIGKRIELRT